MTTNQFLSFLGQIVPGSRHLQKLMALLALRHLLGNDRSNPGNQHHQWVEE